MCFVWSHQFIAIELPRASLVDKISVGPLRFANFFLFMMAICWVVRKWPSLLDFRVTNVMGRASLDVYTAHIIFIYIWMSTPNSIRYHAPWNVIVPIVACVLLWALACLRTRKTAKNK
jgi:peptidoglycan/LPS O-acetylase OafA/YrhL